jgi:general stress protein 26
MKKSIVLSVLFLIVEVINSSYSELYGQPSFNRDTIILAAHEIINETSYCGLVTVDTMGQPQIRTMNPFPVKEDFVIWFATSRASRKIREIRTNPKVCVYFANHLSAKGYVNINGYASVIDNRELLFQMKRDYWDGIQGWQDKFVLIRIVPKSLEIINYKHGLNNDPDTFKAPGISF